MLARGFTISTALRVLIIESDADVGRALRGQIREWGFRAELASSVERARPGVENGSYDVTIADLEAPTDGSLQELLDGNPGHPFVLLAEDSTIDQAVRAIRSGARDFLTKPVDLASLRASLEVIRREAGLRARARRLDEGLETARFGRLIGKSPPMQKIFELIRVLAGNDTSVLITGETGTGKEEVARAIHENGDRTKRPFIALNCAALPRDLAESQLFGHEKGAFTGAVQSQSGCFELADGGTLLLDEVGEMDPDLQAKLLRVLETKKVRRLGGRKEHAFDVRVLAATNKNPRGAIRKGTLREDLFYRLSVFTIAIPGLRRRKSDIPFLIQHFITSFNERHDCSVEGVGDEAMRELRQHSWPGNVRELRNVIERAVVLCQKGWIGPGHLPAVLHEDPARLSDEGHIHLAVGTSLRDAEREIVKRTLATTDNNRSETARILGVDVKTVRKKIRDYEITLE